jgi:hypothetical protein
MSIEVHLFKGLRHNPRHSSALLLRRSTGLSWRAADSDDAIVGAQGRCGPAARSQVSRRSGEPSSGGARRAGRDAERRFAKPTKVNSASHELCRISRFPAKNVAIAILS